MKTKLTLNIDDRIIARAKKASYKRKVSLSSVVENYLERFTETDTLLDKENKQPSLLETIRKFTKNSKPLPKNYDYKKEWNKHLDEKYGK